MDVIDEGFIWCADDVAGPRRTCSGISLVRAADGRVLSSFRVGSTKDSADGNCVVAESGDQGRTWQVICEGFEATHGGVAGEMRSAELLQPRPGVLSAFLGFFERPRGDESLYDAETDSLLPSRLLLARSDDGGRTWVDYRTVDARPHTGTSVCGPVARLGNGEFLLALESHEHREGSNRAVHSALTIRALDGEKLGPIVTVAEDPEHRVFYWDQRLAVSPADGRPVGMFWTYDREREVDQPIHIAWADPQGEHWETPRSTGIVGQIAAPIPLADGRLLAFYVLREPPGQMRLIASDDGGVTWDAEGALVVYSKGAPREAGSDGESDFGQYWDDMFAWTFGHPAAVILDPTTLLLGYYAGADVTHLSARWAMVKL